MGIVITQKGSFSKSISSLNNMLKVDINAILQASGQDGVRALEDATPFESGLAAASWHYVVESRNGSHTIVWTNSDVENGFPVVIMLQYGYGTGTGGYVQGRDFINPAIRPIFDMIADRVWKAVTSA